MSKKPVFQPFVIISALILVIALLGLHPVTPAHAAAIKIMPLGEFDHRHAGLLAFHPVEPVAKRRVYQHRLCRHADGSHL